MPEVYEKRGISELFSDFTAEVKIFLRNELRLFKLEITEKISLAGKHLALIAVGGVLLFAGLMTLLGAIVWLLALAMQVWLASLIVGLVVSAAGYYLVRKHLNDLKKSDYRPRETIESLREIKEEGKWMKGQI